MSVKTTLMSFCLSAIALSGIAADQIAFPGAQGWGRFAKGARATTAPTVYHVTNLNDSGTGSLRDAVSQPNRIVVFDVSGVIKLNSRIVFSKNLYVAGQTAPGEGITVYGNGVSFSGSDNIICRYLRVRMGHGGDSGKDCAGVANGYNMIFDHCSFSWGLDETFSINAFGQAGDITIQNTIMGQGLTPHSAGGLMQCDRITLYRNLYIDNTTRNNKVKGQNQYANNIVYNWSNGCYIMGGDSEGTSYVNIESNCFINGPGGGGNCFGGANADFHCYGIDNWQDSNRDGVYNPSEVTNYSAATRESDPYDYPELELYPGNQLIEKNIPTVGASLPYRDQSDYYMVDELMSFGKQGAFIQNESSLPIGVPSSWEWWSGEKRVDTDGDGMPDAWEEANGTDKTKNDATVKAANGYLNIENYINSITVADRQYFLRKPITLGYTATTSTLTLTWRDYTYAEDGFEVSYKLATESDYKTAGTAAANATSFTIKDLQDGVAYDVRVRAVGSNAGALAYSGYTSGTFKTRPVEVGVVDIDSYEPDVTNSTEVAAGQKLLLHSDEALAINLTSAIEPSSVVATGKGVITVTGASINGQTTSVNKGDQGTLVLNNNNNYKGATVLHDGVLEFNSIANGDVASAIGASSEFAQNWVMDGGTYRYTGANATTNRSAKLTNPTTFEIASGKTVTMNGTIEGYGDNQDLTLDGNGQVTVNTTNFFGYTGKTILKGGTLYLSSLEIAQKLTGNSRLVLAGGTLSMPNKEGTGKVNNTGTIEVMEGTYSCLKPYMRDNYKYKLVGAGTFEWQVPYLREYFDCNLSEFTGKIVANGVNASGNAIFVSNGVFNMPHTQVYLKGVVYMTSWETNATCYVGGISGDAGTFLIGSSKNTANHKCKWVVGSANSDETFDGIINNLPAGLNKAYSGTTSIQKVGTGLWRLNGQNAYAGTTDIDAGTLIVNGKHSGGGNYTVKSEATLKGCGTIAQGIITVQNGGTLTSGDTLVSNKNFNLSATTVNLQSGSRLCVPISMYGLTKKSNTFSFGTLNISEGAVLEVDMTNVPNGIPVDAKFTVFTNAAQVNGTFSSVLPATPGEGLQWDLSDLYSKGVIYVREEGAPTYTYVEENLFSESGKVDGEGYYWFNTDNNALTSQYIANGTITFDAAGKASVADYEMKTTAGDVLGKGVVKMSKASQVVFRSPANISKVKMAFFRVSGNVWGSVSVSTDSIDWTPLAEIDNTVYELNFSNINSVDLTLKNMADYEYRYVKVEQTSSLTPTYLAGVSIFYQKKELTGLDKLSLEQDAEVGYDMLGRKVSGKQGIVVNKNKIIFYNK